MDDSNSSVADTLDSLSGLVATVGGYVTTQPAPAINYTAPPSAGVSTNNTKMIMILAVVVVAVMVLKH